MNNMKTKILIRGKHGTIKKRKDSNSRKAGKSKATVKSKIPSNNNLPQKHVPIKHKQVKSLRGGRHRDPKPGAHSLSLGVGTFLGQTGERRLSQARFYPKNIVYAYM